MEYVLSHNEALDEFCITLKEFPEKKKLHNTHRVKCSHLYLDLFVFIAFPSSREIHNVCPLTLY